MIRRLGDISAQVGGQSRGVPVDFRRGGMGFGFGTGRRPFQLLKPGLPPLDQNNPGVQRVYGGNTLWDAAQIQPYRLSFPMPASAQRYLNRAYGIGGGMQGPATLSNIIDFFGRR